jgi:hypothetical protein
MGELQHLQLDLLSLELFEGREITKGGKEGKLRARLSQVSGRHCIGGREFGISKFGMAFETFFRVFYHKHFGNCGYVIFDEDRPGRRQLGDTS